MIVSKFLKGFPTDEGLCAPRVEIASMYIDQFPESDMGRAMAQEHGVPIFHSIPAALCLGGQELAVDGVLSIGEHGDYAWNEKEQQLYPRRYFMEQICGVMATSKRGVPVFNDKHLSYSWTDALWMYQRAQAVGAAFMGGIFAAGVLATTLGRARVGNPCGGGGGDWVFWAGYLRVPHPRSAPVHGRAAAGRREREWPR